VKLPLHVSVHTFDYSQGARMPYFVLLQDWIPLICVRRFFVLYVAVCAYRQFVCVNGALVKVRSGYHQISP
jgi:hypothetical protein